MYLTNIHITSKLFDNAMSLDLLEIGILQGERELLAEL